MSFLIQGAADVRQGAVNGWASFHVDPGLIRVAIVDTDDVRVASDDPINLLVIELDEIGDENVESPMEHGEFQFPDWNPPDAQEHEEHDDLELLVPSVRLGREPDHGTSFGELPRVEV